MTAPSTDPTVFRQLLGRFASGVTVATARDSSGQLAGMTASAIASVSLEPPLLVVCVNHDDPFHEALRAAPRFAINVLARDQEPLSRQFAGEPASRFHGVRYQQGPGALPLLEGAVAHIICEPWDVIRAGDHTLFLGLVVDGAVFERPPLLHFRGAYTTTLTDT